jgi:hypothetical protein
MKSRQVWQFIGVSVLLAGALGASAQEVVQTLDQVKAFGTNDVLDMTFSDPYRDAGFTLPESPATPITSGSAFVACKQTSAAGLICLTADEKIVNWSDPVDGASRAGLFSCNDVDRILDVRASNTCTGVTADELGAIWLAGKNKGKTHSLVKVTAGACPNGTTGVSQTFTSSTGGGNFCAREWDTGRPLLLSVERVEGQVAIEFDVPGKTDTQVGDIIVQEGDTIVGLEQRLNAVIFSATTPNDVYEIPGGRSGWALNLKEQLQDIALLQASKDGGYDNYVLVTTNEGDVMAKDMANPSIVAYAVWTARDWTVINASCTSVGATFSLAASPKREIVYLSNSNCKSVVALKAAKVAGKLSLIRATERFVDDTGITPVTSYPIVPALSTDTYSLVGITVAPGQDFKLADCSGGEAEGCSQVPGFKLWNLNFINGVAVDSGVTVLQILNIPDCRWRFISPCTPAAIFDPDGTNQKSAQYLNVEPLLPKEVLDVLEAKDVTLPGQLLIPPQHRAEKRNNHMFDAFFFVVDDSVKFTGIFDGEFEMEKLIGKESRCAGTIGVPSVDNGNGIVGLDWDIVTKISEQERYVSVDGLFQDMLLNTGCGSSRTKTITLSMYNYPLEITPDTWLPDAGTNGVLVTNNDAVFARYMQKLFYDLDYVARHYACNLSDAADGYPASDLLCSTLVSNLVNAGDKLDKCIAATYQPKQSAGNQNCTSFLQQWASVKAVIESIITADAGREDPANRRYELKQRTLVFDHVYDTRFWPSVPQGGYCREAYVLAGGTAETGCPTP